MAWSPHQRRAFRWALGLHAAVLLFILLSSVVVWWRTPQEPIFTLINLEAPTPTPAPAAAPATPSRRQPIHVDPLPEPPPPPPTPSRQPPSQPQPTPAPPTEPAPEQISYEEFLRQNPHLRDTPSTPTPTAPDAEALREALAAVLVTPEASRDSGRPAASPAALATWVTQLRSAVDRAWRQPPAGDPVSRAARVEFSVSATGRIHDVRLVQRSGQAAFDQAVLRAFAEARSPGPAPDGQPRRLALTFRWAPGQAGLR